MARSGLAIFEFCRELGKGGPGPAAPTDVKILGSLFISKVWAGHPVSFDLLTYGDVQFVAFYDAERKMTVGMRNLDAGTWTFEQPKGVWAGKSRPTVVGNWMGHPQLSDHGY